MKKVLWVTSWFPPRVGVATIRNIKLLKYLPLSAWEAMVVCPLEQLEHTKLSRDLLDQLGASVTVSPGPRDPFYLLLDRRESDKKAQYLTSLMNNLIPPDGHLLWATLVLFHIGRQINLHSPDLVYTNCSPFSGNLIGAWVKYRYKIPWATDFRDLWTLNPMSGKRFLNSYYRVVSGWLERFYLKRCDALIVNTDGSRSRMVSKYPWLINKTWVIPNGYDQEYIPRNAKAAAIPRSILYAGTIDRRTTYTPLPLFELLSKLPADGNDANWTLHYVGNESEVFLDLAREAGISFACKTHGYLDQASYYDLIRRMDYVTLCMPFEVDSKSWVPARIYDYIGNKSRIICLAHRHSEVLRLLQEYDNGLILLYDEPEAQRIERLREYLLQPQRNHEPSEGFVKSFSRREIAKRLAQVFDRLTASNMSEGKSS